MNVGDGKSNPLFAKSAYVPGPANHFHQNTEDV